MGYTDWNKSLEYAMFVCSEFPNVGWESYQMYDGRRGIYLILFDSSGTEFRRLATGIWNYFPEMKKAIDAMLRRLLTE